MNITFLFSRILLPLLAVGWLFTSAPARADTPVSLYQSFAGQVNFTGTAQTLRTQPNSRDACAVTSRNTTAKLDGLPTGATIEAAYLYWAGSGNGDYDVSFEGNNVSADRQYTATGGGRDYFSGVADVTATVAAKGNGTYGFRGLSVDTGWSYCSSQAVLAGWALLVVYSDPGEDFRVLNVFEGFQSYWGSSLTLTPSNFQIPTSPINGRHAHITWEGDDTNSGSRNGYVEELDFEGNILTDAVNPPHNQFNSASTITTPADTATYGVDFDVYDVSAYLSAGQSTASSVYSSGQDLVFLSAEIMSVTNIDVADLAIDLSHTGDFSSGENHDYSVVVSNNGPRAEPGPVTVTDTLPVGMSYVSASGSGWSCGVSGQVVTCSHSGPMAAGESLPALTLTVNVTAAPGSGTLVNTATVAGSVFDNIASNNTVDDAAVIAGLPGGFCDDFESGLGRWTVVDAGISGQTWSSPSNSLYTSGGNAVATSEGRNLASYGSANVTYWLRRGDDGFSENPDNGEDLLVEYYDDTGAWQTLATYAGGDTQGEVFNGSHALPAAALHGNFRVRFRQLDGTNGWDFWHVDDVCINNGDPGTVGGELTYYPMDETAWSGTAAEVTDGSGGGHEATAIGDATTSGTTPAVGGSPGTCRYGEFDGSGDYLRDEDAELYLNGLSGVTVTAWVKSRQVGYDGGIFAGIAKGAQDADLGLRYDVDGWGGGGSNVIKASLRTSAGSTQVETVSGQQSTGWQHLALVWQSGQSIRVYVNGTEAAKSYDEGPLSGTVSGIDLLDIGHGTKGDDWDGFIDEFRLFDRALSAAEVATVMNATHDCGGGVGPVGCAAVFPSALQNSDPGGSIDFGWDAEVSDPDNALETQNLTFNSWGNATCGSTDCTATNTSSSTPWMDPFVTSGSTTDVNVGWQGSFTLGGGGTSEYRDITGGGRSTITDGGGQTSYRIRSLTLNDRDDLELRGGVDYWIENFTMSGSRHNITVTGAGTARLFIRNAASFAWRADVNDGGTSDQLLIAGYGDLAFDNGSNGSLNAMVYAAGDVTVSSDMAVNGSIAAGGAIALGSGAVVSYDATAVDSVDDRGFCGPGPAQLDHFQIDVGTGNASTCSPRAVTVTAVGSDGNPFVAYGGTVSLGTSSGHGNWSSGGSALNSDDSGAAVYTFTGASASFALANSHADDLVVTVSDGAAGVSSTSTGLSFRDNAFVMNPATCTGSSCPATGSTELVAYRPHDFVVEFWRRDPTTGNCAIDTNYAGSLNLKGWLTRDAVDPGGLAPAVSGVLLPDAQPGTGNIALNFTNGTAALALDTTDVGKYVLNLLDDSSGHVVDAATDPANPVPIPIAGSSETLTVRPFAVDVRNVRLGDGTANPGSSTAAGGIFTCAGDLGGVSTDCEFGATVVGVGWDAGDDTGNDGVPDPGADLTVGNPTVPAFAWGVELVATTPAYPDPTTPGRRVGGLRSNGLVAGDFTSGSATDPALQYEEVGSFTLQSIPNNDYLTAGVAVPGDTELVGRFVPHHFRLAVAVDGTIADANVAGPVGFTYTGQATGGYVANPEVTAVAENAAGTAAWNYAGAYNKLGLGDIAIGYPDSDNTQLGTDGVNIGLAATEGVHQLTKQSDLDASDPASGYVAGQTTLVIGGGGHDVFTYTRANALVPPFRPDIVLTVSVAEADDGVADIGDAQPNPTGIAANAMRFGIVSLKDTYGPQDEDLMLPLEVLFYDEPGGNAGFFLNEDDADSAFNGTTDLACVDLDNTDARGCVTPDDSVRQGGWFIVDSNGEPGPLQFDLTVPAWLQVDSDGDGTWGESPSATATFGLFRGNDRFLFWREER